MCTRAGAIHGKHPYLIKERRVSSPGALPCDVESFALSRIDLDSGFNSFLSHPVITELEVLLVSFIDQERILSDRRTLYQRP